MNGKTVQRACKPIETAMVDLVRANSACDIYRELQQIQSVVCIHDIYTIADPSIY